ncbi:MAG: hypothetical protein JNN11_03610 [Candidatus Doudnabacteria bacterium]|nr:hypothetical protein [Candidatus Doudnabacteria bacterium]
MAPECKWSFVDLQLWSGSAKWRVAAVAENQNQCTSLCAYTPAGGIFFVHLGAPIALAVASYCPDLDEAAAIALAVLGCMLDEADLRQILAESLNPWVAPLLKLLSADYPDHQYLKKVLVILESEISLPRT